MAFAIGIDLGGTHLRAALVDRDGEILAHERIRTEAHEGAEAVVGRITQLINAMIAAANGAPIVGAGIAAPGPLNPFTGTVITMPNLPGWENFPIRDRIAAQVPFPVVLGNDANLAAVGEWLFGGGRGMQNMIYVTISTGVGGGVICDGRLLLGHNGFAAEVGHMVLDPHGFAPATATPAGSWEALASGTFLAYHAAEAMRAGTATVLNQLTTPNAVTTHHLDLAAQQGDELAIRLIENAGFWCGIAFVNLLHMFSPEAIFVGGGVSNLGDRLLNPARAEITKRALPGYRNVPIHQTKMGDNLGVLGAAAYAFSSIEQA
ncbi:MAG: ROK family protein [Chloroflexi bacterium]|nr:ROK family protein [Chloroflexota bacterium]